MRDADALRWANARLRLQNFGFFSHFSVLRHLVGRLAAWEVSAADSLWQDCVEWLPAYAEACLRHLPQNMWEPDEIAVNAYTSICRMIKSHSIQLREQLWPFLATITVGKLIRR